MRAVLFLVLIAAWLTVGVRGAVSSVLHWCAPLPCDSAQFQAAAAKPVRTLDTLDACSGEWHSLSLTAATNRTEFMQTVVSALAMRRPLCPSELQRIVSTTGDLLIYDRPFRPPNIHFDSYDLLSAVLMSNFAEKHTKGGPWLEFGVFRGSSINVTAHIASSLNRSLSIHGFDTFTGLPTEWKGHMKKGEFSLGGVLPPVLPGIDLHAGLFNTTLRKFTKNHSCRAGLKLMGASIDCDLYDGAYFALKHLTNKQCMQEGTILHFHDLFAKIPTKNPMEELNALYDWMAETSVTVRLLPVRSGHHEASSVIVERIGQRTRADGNHLS